MNKKEVLIEKLTNIVEHIDSMQLMDDVANIYLKRYREYINKLIVGITDDLLPSSDGASIGLIRGVSDYDEICANEKLWNLLSDAEEYYSNECKEW